MSPECLKHVDSYWYRTGLANDARRSCLAVSSFRAIDSFLDRRT
jgi:hypothetical protein